ncbi:podocalyxin-like isoform X2 [Carassius carassius]|uniref:podocalyxin-like isoform X2 n=1 Tax=Carassius carassius TaxID=217509 RepID=UPI002868E7C3|nr:podocalyxin-like isoform X2 [Carassius carassius]
MAISWTLIVLGTLLQGMQCNANDNSTTAPNSSISPTSVGASAASSTESTLPPTSFSSTKPTTSSASSESTLRATTPTTLEPSKSPTPSESTTPSESITQAPTTKATSPDQTGPSSTVANQDIDMININTSTQNSQVTTQATTIQPTTSNAGTTHTTTTNTPPNSPTTLTTTHPKQGTTDIIKLATTFSKGDGTTQLMSTQTAPSAVTKNSELPITTEPGSKSIASQSLGTTKPQTTTALIGPGLRRDEEITTNTPQELIHYSFNPSKSNENHVLGQTCKTLLQTIKGNCIINVTIHDNRLTATVIIDAEHVIPPENYKQVSEAPNNTTHREDLSKDTIPDTLIAILASCGALVLILCCFAAYCTYHRRSYRKNQQHLTEELQTVENGYHDNPTLEVMEVQPEMQEKKLTMNREFNDSWIVPIDNLLKEDIPDEEDTHL